MEKLFPLTEGARIVVFLFWYGQVAPELIELMFWYNKGLGIKMVCEFFFCYNQHLKMEKAQKN